MGAVYSVMGTSQDIMFTKDLVFGWTARTEGSHESSWTPLTDLDLPTLNALLKVSASSQIVPAEVSTTLRALIDGYHDKNKKVQNIDHEEINQSKEMTAAILLNQVSKELKETRNALNRSKDRVRLLNHIAETMRFDDGVKSSNLGYVKLVFEPNYITLEDNTHKTDTHYNRNETCSTLEKAVDLILARWW